MKKSKVRYDNARHPEQAERMKLLEKKVGCFFCDNNYLQVGASPAVHEGKYWFIKKSDYPYTGTVHHYLVASKRHVIDITKIDGEAWQELPSMLSWLKKYLKTKGEGIFVRSGDMRYTGATLDHIHFHFISGAPQKKGSTIADNILVTLGHKKNKTRSR